MHGITAYAVRDEPRFEDCGAEICAFFSGHLPRGTLGVLVAYNGDSCDFPFLAYELHRAGVEFPQNLAFTLDTLAQLRKKRGLGLGLQDIDATVWPVPRPVAMPFDGDAGASPCGDAGLFDPVSTSFEPRSFDSSLSFS